MVTTRSERRINNTKLDPSNNMYQFFTTEENFGIENENSNIVDYLLAQKAYSNSMKTYSEVNTATQYAIEHLILNHQRT